MASIRKFDRKMIESHLKASNLKYFVDDDGDFRVEFAYHDDAGCALTVLLTAEGSNHQIYRVLVVSNKRVAKADWGKAIAICNRWNEERFWPKAYLYVRDPSKDTSGTIYLEHQMDLEAGVHQEMLDQFTRCGIGGAFQFWTWATKEQGL